MKFSLPKLLRSKARRIVVTAAMAGLLVPIGLVQLPAAAAPPAPDDKHTAVGLDGIAPGERKAILGDRVATYDDVAYSVLSDADGISVLRASSLEGYRWETVASIPVGVSETDLWMANSCLTSSGSFMAVVYGPRSISNDAALFGGGAQAAIVNLKTGEVRELGHGYSMAYFNPGCGAKDKVAIARYPDESGTSLLAVVDANTGHIDHRFSADEQVTSPTVDIDGNIVAATGKGLVKFTETEKPQLLVSTPGFAYGLTMDGRGRLGYLSHQGEVGRAQLLDLTKKNSKPKVIATGPIQNLGLASAADGALYVLGDDLTVDLSGTTGVKHVKGARWDATVSSTGGIVVNVVKPVGYANPQNIKAEDISAAISAVAIETGKPIKFGLADHAHRNSKVVKTATVTSQTTETASAPSYSTLSLDAATLVAPAAAPASAALPAGSPTSPIDDSGERYCSVPRNDPANQAYQPKPRQVEWAVDMAVASHLTIKRDANWRNLGMAEYYPGTMFPATSLLGGGTIPPQIVLGVLAQESNLWQASRYTAPGETGNPLIGDFYGSRPHTWEAPESIWDIEFPAADCGYGVGQITDGMRLPGRGQATMPYAQQRAIALDYVANVAKAVQMLGIKWNEVRSAGMQINNGTSSQIENWFFAVWAYNSGFHQNTGGHWGVGWSNNPINPIYPPLRSAFLDGNSTADASHPQDWPYPEKVMGFAAWSLTLPELQTANPGTRTYPTTYVAGFRLAWWNSDEFRTAVKPAIATFCSLDVNDCDPMMNTCTLSSFECWWNEDASWKVCPTACGYGFDRFSPWYNYQTELSAGPDGLSFPANCSAPPAGVLVVDDVSNAVQPARYPCTKKTTQGSFQFQFYSPDSGGHYPGKIDLHQLGSGFNGHMYFTHMRKSGDTVNNLNNRLKITGTWTLGQALHQWTRVWIHVPDHAAWTDQAAYTINFGNGQSQTRYLQQKVYANQWIPIGVFAVDGVPSVSLSNISTTGVDADVDDVAWDAVGFQPLAAKPAHFVVALGDSFSSGEGAGAYYPSSDHDGTVAGARNACHQSTNSWTRKATLPGESSTIGALADARSASMDFQFLACSGAETENLLPYYTTGSLKPTNLDAQNGSVGQYGMVSQLDAGYLDANTTLVTLSIGGNDLRFVPIVQKCVLAGMCADIPLEGDYVGMEEASHARLESGIPLSVGLVIQYIQQKAPNAKIVLMGYPPLFSGGTGCILINDSNATWLNGLSAGLKDAMQEIAENRDSPAHRVTFADPTAHFNTHSMCNPTSGAGINSLLTTMTAGDQTWGILLPNTAPVSSESVHPNNMGTSLYAYALEDVLVGLYP